MARPTGLADLLSLRARPTGVALGAAPRRAAAGARGAPQEPQDFEDPKEPGEHEDPGEEVELRVLGLSPFRTGKVAISACVCACLTLNTYL